MPFANKGRLITRLAQEFRNILLSAVERLPIANIAVQMAVLSRKDHGPRWTADRIRDKTPIKPHSFCRQAIEIRRRVSIASIATHRLIRVVVGHDKQDVRPILSSVGQSRRAHVSSRKS